MTSSPLLLSTNHLYLQLFLSLPYAYRPVLPLLYSPNLAPGRGALYPKLNTLPPRSLVGPPPNLVQVLTCLHLNGE